MAERTTELRHDIEETRTRMTGTVDAIEDRVSPGRMIERRMASVRQVSTRLRHQVMGAPRHAASSAGSGARQTGARVADAGSAVAETASSAASTMREQVAEAPARIEHGVEGNPLAAGAVAFGIGVLVATLPPTARPEEELAGKIMEPLQEEARSMGQEVVQAAKEGAQEAVEHTREAASEAMSEVQDQAKGAADEVAGRAEEVKDEVASQAQGAKDEVTGA